MLRFICSLAIVLLLNAIIALSYEGPEDFIDYGVGYELTSSQINGTMNLGDTVQLEINIHSNIAGYANFSLQYQGGLNPVGVAPGVQIVTDSTYLDTGAVTKTYSMVVSSLVPSELFYTLKPKKVNEHFLGAPSGAVVALQYNADLSSGRLIPYSNECEGGYFAANDNDDNCRTFAKAACVYNLPNPPTTLKHIKVQGKYVYNDLNSDIGSTPKRGAFNDMWIFFHKKNKPLDINNLYHPVPSATPIYGVHYTKCDANGNFSFDFFYKKDSLRQTDPTADWEILVFPAKQNTAIVVYSPTNHWTILNNYDLYNNPNTTGTPTFCHYFAVQFDTSTTFTDYTFPKDLYISNIKWGWEDGAFLRNAEVSRRFLVARVGSSLVAQHQIKQADGYRVNTPGLIGKQDTTSIIFKSYEYRCAIFSVAHEYGHYIDEWWENPTGGNLAPSIVTEGWAMFYSFAVRAWAERNYDYASATSVFDENPEIAPWFRYYQTCTSDTSKNYKFERFGNLSKANSHNSSGFNMCRWTCAMWNLYDSFHDSTFMPLSYEGKNNDDVNDFGRTFFIYAMDSLHYGTGVYFSNFMDGFKDIIAPDPNDPLRIAVDKIGDFMKFGQTTIIQPDTISKASGGIRMGSPSLDYQLQPISGSQVRITWGTTKTYNLGIKDSTWNFTKTNSDSTKEYWQYYYDYNADNKEDGVKLYQDSSSNWNLISTAFINNTDSITVNNSVSNNYKIETFNYTDSLTYSPNSYDDSYPPFEFSTPYAKISLNNAQLSTVKVSNSPNPFNHATLFTINVAEACQMTIKIYDANGNYTKTIFDDYVRNGIYYAKFYPENTSSGIYFANITIVCDNGEIDNNTIKLILER